MSQVKSSGPDYRALQSLFEPAAMGVGFELTVSDRVGIERLCAAQLSRFSEDSSFLRMLLRHKLNISRGAPEPAPRELVTSNRQVTYMIGPVRVYKGLLTFKKTNYPEHIHVGSTLGATLIGMRSLQKSPLMHRSGRVDTVFVLDVDLSRAHWFDKIDMEIQRYY